MFGTAPGEGRTRDPDAPCFGFSGLPHLEPLFASGIHQRIEEKRFAGMEGTGHRDHVKLIVEAFVEECFGGLRHGQFACVVDGHQLKWFDQGTQLFVGRDGCGVGGVNTDKEEEEEDEEEEIHDSCLLVATAVASVA